jgi:hypothetical protein
MERRRELMTKLVVLVFIGISSIHAQPIANQEITAETMLKYCTAPDNSGPLTACYWYVAGYAHGSTMAKLDAGRPVCMAAGVSPFQLVQVTVKFLKDHPNILHLPIENVLWQAFEQAFPCPVPAKSQK